MGQDFLFEQPEHPLAGFAGDVVPRQAFAKAANPRIGGALEKKTVGGRPHRCCMLEGFAEGEVGGKDFKLSNSRHD
jgi:hypothetical protein